jgi:hypothetical protein
MLTKRNVFILALFLACIFSFVEAKEEKVFPKSNATLPTGFIIFSRGRKQERTLYKVTLKPGMTEAQVRASETLICKKGDKGGDIQGQISFDGKMLAFARNRGEHGHDYHSFHNYDVYVLRLDGKLPATPVRVGHGYWPSWGDDSSSDNKTLYFSKHTKESGSIHKTKIDKKCKASAIEKVADLPTDKYEGFAMASPDGTFAAVRYGGGVYAVHYAGRLKDKVIHVGGGCMPHVTADSQWVFHAMREVARADGKARGNGEGSGNYHYGSSADMKWFITKFTGHARNQNKGGEVMLCTLASTATSFKIQHRMLVSDDGSWVDVHSNGKSSGRKSASKSEVKDTKPEDMVFVWEDAKTANHLYDNNQDILRSCSVSPKGRSRIGKHHAMDCRNGSFVTLNSSKPLLAECKKTHQISIELQFQARKKQGKDLSALVSFSDGKNNPNFILGQKGKYLYLRINLNPSKSSTMVALGKIKSGKQYHLVVSYRLGLLEWFINGKRKTKKISGDFKAWLPGQLIFGGQQDGQNPWNGYLSNVRIFNKSQAVNEVSKSYKAAVKRHKTKPKVPTITLKVKLLNTSKALTVKEIIALTYHRCLVAHEYEVLEVIKGKCDAKKIKIMHWAILDRVLEPTRTKGQEYTLKLQLRSLHSELNKETVSDDIEDFDLKEFVDIGS